MYVCMCVCVYVCVCMCVGMPPLPCLIGQLNNNTGQGDDIMKDTMMKLVSDGDSNGDGSNSGDGDDGDDDDDGGDDGGGGDGDVDDGGDDGGDDGDGGDVSYFISEALMSTARMLRRGFLKTRNNL